MKDILIGMLKTFFTTVQTGIDVTKIHHLLRMTGGITTSSDLVSEIYDIVSGIATGLAIIYFFYEANSKWAFEGNDISPKSLAGPFLKLIMAVMIISNCQNWLDVAYSSFTTHLSHVTAAVNAQASSISIPDTAANDIVKNLGLIRQVGFLVPLLILWAASSIVTLLFVYKAALYKIEFAFRVGVSPLAMADAYNGMNSSSVRWFKGMIGFVLYGCAFVIVPKLAADVIGSVDFFTYYDTAGNACQGTLADGINTTVGYFTGGGTAAKDYLKNSGLISLIVTFLPGLLIPVASLGVLGAIQQVCREAAS